MFEQLEMCRPGNYLPVTGSSGRELRPLQGENRGHISFFCSLFISFPHSGSFCVALPRLSVYFLSLFLCTYKQTEDRISASFFFYVFWISRCGGNFFSLLPLCPLPHLPFTSAVLLYSTSYILLFLVSECERLTLKS